MEITINNQILRDTALCNNIIRNLCCSIIAKKHNLLIDYNFVQGGMNNMCDMIISLGIPLFYGTNKYDKYFSINDENYPYIYNYDGVIDFNIIGFENHYFQTPFISNVLYNYFKEEINTTNIIMANKFNHRYNNNNDIFIHIRLNILSRLQIPQIYFEKVIELLEYDNIYLASDNPNHEICLNLCNKYANCNIIYYDEVDTIHFGSTCKNIILSNGTFSYTVGILSFYSHVYYPEKDVNNPWHGDIFVIPSWNKVNYL
jgi:hypothetical protein